MRPAATLGAGCLLLLCAAPVRAGICDAKLPLRHEFQLLAGFSPESKPVIGTAEDRQFVLAGLVYSYRCREWGSISVSYTGALMPVAVLIQPDGHAVYGFAAAPVGATFEFARGRRVHPVAHGLLGIMASAEPVPVRAVNATGLNFTIDLGGGVRVNTGARGAVTLGYRFFHISNAGTTNYNPGVDNHVIYAGYSFLR